MIRLQRAGVDDAETILGFIRALAAYEREPDAVEVDARTLRQQLAERAPPFECWLARLDQPSGGAGRNSAPGDEAGAAVGFVLFFATYSTWRGKRGIWLEDLFVLPEYRGQGVGRRLLAHVAQLAVARGCGRLEWSVLNWNAPAIAFYEALGAQRMTAWTNCRVSRGALAALAKASDGVG